MIALPAILVVYHNWLKNIQKSESISNIFSFSFEITMRIVCLLARIILKIRKNNQIRGWQTLW
jgi:hypothetical protein